MLKIYKEVPIFTVVKEIVFNGLHKIGVLFAGLVKMW